MNLRKFMFLAVLIFSGQTFSAYAQNISLTNLLQGWLENDREIKSAAIVLNKAELSNSSLKIENGFNMQFSTGSMRFTMNGGKSIFTINPEIKAELPSVRNLALTAESDITFSNETQISNTALKAEINILDSEKNKRNLSEKKSVRAIIEAKRNLESKAGNSEKSFFTTLKNLLKQHESILSAQKDYYSDIISFEKIKSQGFSETSSSYKLAQIKVLNDEHSIENQKRTLNHDFINFLMKCGYQSSMPFDVFIKLILSELPDEEPLDFSSFEKSNYKSIENALWTQEINSLSRNSDSRYSLSGNAGYTFNNSNLLNLNSSGKSSDSIDTGISSSFFGVKLNAGVNIPVNPGTEPAFSASISFSPETLRLDKIKIQENFLDSSADKITVENAFYNYELDAMDKKNTKEDLLWEKKTVQENFQMYSSTEKEMKKYFDAGIITESEYMSALSNKDKYEIEQIINQLETIIFNNEIRNLFYNKSGDAAL